MEMRIMLNIKPTMDKIINAGMDANTHLIIKDTMEPNGISKSTILTGCVLCGLWSLLFVTSIV